MTSPHTFVLVFGQLFFEVSDSRVALWYDGRNASDRGRAARQAGHVPDVGQRGISTTKPRRSPRRRVWY